MVMRVYFVEQLKMSRLRIRYLAEQISITTYLVNQHTKTIIHEILITISHEILFDFVEQEESTTLVTMSLTNIL
jgi:hypothetical protein